MLRPAREGDYEAFVGLMAELGVDDPVPEKARFVERLMPVMTVAVDDTDRAIGYVTWRRYGAIAHVVQIAVDPAHRGKQVAHTLLERVRALATTAGCTRWYLNVKQENARAIRVYEHVGFRIEIESWFVRLAWSKAAGFGSPGTASPVPVTEDLDGPIGRRFGLDPARIATLRTRPGSIAIALLEDGEPVGFTAFDPSFPGCVPFPLAHPRLIGAMLAACRPHAKHDYLNLSIEGDRALVDALLTGGATLNFALYQMSAAL